MSRTSLLVPWEDRGYNWRSRGVYVISVEQTYRLITRLDFDGFVAAVLLRQRGLLEEIKFVHPKDVQDGLISLSQRDITTGVPYQPEVALAFDHRDSRILSPVPDNLISNGSLSSSARAVYEYFGGSAAFPELDEGMVEAADRAGTATFSRKEVLQPEDWNLLNFILDPRTGLGRFKNFRISTYQLMLELIEFTWEHTILEIMALKDVAERVNLYFEHQQLFQEQILAVGRMAGSVLIVDLRSQEEIYAGNRFIKYALYPEANVSIQIAWGFRRQNTVITVGKSIFNRTLAADIGSIMARHGGSGHCAAGTCQVENTDVEPVIADIQKQLLH